MAPATGAHPAPAWLYTALDLNPAGIRFCQQHHRLPRLDFVQGDAEALQFSSNVFDVVFNIDSSTCYPNFPQFMAEVARVLRPGGFFLYADKRGGSQMDEWEKELRDAPFELLKLREINVEVLRGMTRKSPRSQDLIARCLPKILHRLGAEWSSVEGSRTYYDVADIETYYRSYCLKRR